jgi:hypothetical protein
LMLTGPAAQSRFLTCSGNPYLDLENVVIREKRRVAHPLQSHRKGWVIRVTREPHLSPATPNLAGLLPRNTECAISRLLRYGHSRKREPLSLHSAIAALFNQLKSRSPKSCQAPKHRKPASIQHICVAYELCSSSYT